LVKPDETADVAGVVILVPPDSHRHDPVQRVSRFQHRYPIIDVQQAAGHLLLDAYLLLAASAADHQPAVDPADLLR
jgi:hypothetical protein